MKGIETFFRFKVCEMFRTKLDAYIKCNLVYFSLDEDGNFIYTVVRNKKFYKVPEENVRFWFPEDYYENGELKGRFQKLKKVGKVFYAIYKVIDDEKYFIVNKRLKVVKVNSEES